MDIITVLVTVVLAYTIGAASPAYLIAHWVRGIDIRGVGSGNAGAANTFRQVGMAAGLTVLVMDALKGVIAVLTPGLLGAPEGAAFIAAIAVVVGHNWSVFLGFRGGKGVATVLGVSLAMIPGITIIAAIPAALVIALTRNVVLGGALGFLLLNALTIATGQPGPLVALCLFLSVIIVTTHLAGTWRQYLEALRTRQWQRMLWVE